MKNDLLIPLDLHIREKCDNCRKANRKFFKHAKALVHKGGLEFISLNCHSTFMHGHLIRLKDMAINSHSAEDYSFYASHAKSMIEKWTLFVEDILNMAADPANGAIKNDLQQALGSVNTELKNLIDHCTSAHEILFQMGAPAPTKEILKAYAEGHQSDDCE